MSETPMKPSEFVEVGLAAEREHRSIIAANWQEIQAANAKRARDPNAPTIRLGDSRDAGAKAAGVPKTRYRRAKEVVLAARADPTLADLVVMMDETGDVARSFNELRRRRRYGPTGKKPRHVVLNKTRRIDPNRELERSVWALDGICDVLSKLDVDRIDKARAEAWAKALRKSARTISSTARKVSDDPSTAQAPAAAE